jgi:hypothetical protein
MVAWKASSLMKVQKDGPASAGQKAIGDEEIADNEVGMSITRPSEGLAGTLDDFNPNGAQGHMRNRWHDAVRDAHYAVPRRQGLQRWLPSEERRLDGLLTDVRGADRVVEIKHNVRWWRIGEDVHDIALPHFDEGAAPQSPPPSANVVCSKMLR